mgnify:CR=1 FL=1
MSEMHFENHPTDPDKVIIRKHPRIDQGPDYERGFIDGMQEQMRRSVDKAVNAMAKREWVGLTDEEIGQLVSAVWPREATPADFIRAIEAKLKEKNS